MKANMKRNSYKFSLHFSEASKTRNLKEKFNIFKRFGARQDCICPPLCIRFVKLQYPCDDAVKQ